MRIDSYATPYRVAQGSSSATAIASESAASQADTPSSSAVISFDGQSSSQGAYQPQSTGSSLSVATPSSYEQNPLASQAAKAIASYSSTASYSFDTDNSQVLGLDLYA